MNYAKSKTYIDSVIIIGFKLYPNCIFKLDDTFNSIFGKNGVGKTTILDAIQVGIIANQHYIKFNVTTHKDDRTLGDYMYSHTGYILFNVGGTPKKYAFGVRLLKQPDGKVEIKTMVVENTHLTNNDFFNGTMLYTDLNQLHRNIINNYPYATVNFPESIAEYHTYLYEKNIVGINISSKISEFSALYRSISTGILQQSNKILKDILAPPDGKSRNLIETLSKSIKQRNIINQKIIEIREIIKEVQNLIDVSNRYIMISYKYFCTEFNRLIGEKKLLSDEIDNAESELKKLDLELIDYTNRIEAKSSELLTVNSELYKIIENISNTEKHLKAHKDYIEIKNSIKESNKKLENFTLTLEEILKKKHELYNRIDSINPEIIELNEHKSSLKYKIGDLKEHVKKLNELKKHISILENTLFIKLTHKNIDQEIRHWQEIGEKIRNITLINQQINTLEEQISLHKKALTILDDLKRYGLTIEKQDDISATLNKEERRIYELKNTIDNKTLEKKRLETKIETLLKGRIDLPDVLKNYHGRFLYREFNEIPIEESIRIESSLGELKKAVVFKDDIDSDLLRGKDRLYFISEKALEKVVPPVLQEYQDGFLMEDSDGILRYEPKPEFPTIGEVSRKKTAEALKKEIELLEADLKNLHNELLERNLIKEKLTNLISIYEYTEKKDLIEKYEHLIRERDYLESKIQIYNKIKASLDIIKQLISYFGRDDYLHDLEESQRSFDEITNKIKILEKSSSELKTDYEKNTEIENQTKEKIDLLKRDINKLEGKKEQLETNFPLKVLNGEIDFNVKDSLILEKDALIDRQNRLTKVLDSLKDEKRKLEYHQTITTNKLRDNIEKLKYIEDVTLNLTTEFSLYFNNKTLEPINYNVKKEEFYKLKGVFEEKLSEFLKKNKKDEPTITYIEDKLNESILKVYPYFQSLSKLEDQLNELSRKLKDIETEIKSAIGNFKNNIDQNILKIKGNLHSTNKDLSAIKFGRIRSINISVKEREAYYKLQKVYENNSILSLLESDSIEYDTFVKELAKNLGYSRTIPTDEDILDYRNYFDIFIELKDEHNQTRTKGLSNGENLGTNILIVLAMLTRFIDGSISNKVLPILLDEADRLDSDSIKTLYEIAEEWGLQMIVALPNIPNFNKGIHYQLIAQDNGIVSIHTRFAK